MCKDTPIDGTLESKVWNFPPKITPCFPFRFFIFILITMKIDVQATEVKCKYNSHSFGCYCEAEDATDKSLTFSFPATQEQKEKTILISFSKVGRVTHLPETLLEEFPKLTLFSIKFSRIPIMRNNLLGSQFSQVERLWLHDNKIEMIEEQTFVYLPNLWWIDLSWNEIQTLSQKVFQKNHKLKYIWLSWNFIKRIEPGTFRNLNQLEVFYLWGNECVDQTIGCMGCDPEEKIDQKVLDEELLHCYDEHNKSLKLLNDGENFYNFFYY